MTTPRDAETGSGDEVTATEQLPGDETEAEVDDAQQAAEDAEE